MYCANVIGQFFLLNGFMGGWYNIFGLELLTGLYYDRKWRESPYFPKVRRCVTCCNIIMIMHEGTRQVSGLDNFHSSS
jgi:hypothetical protein